MFIIYLIFLVPQSDFQRAVQLQEGIRYYFSTFQSCSKLDGEKEKKKKGVS